MRFSCHFDYYPAPYDSQFFINPVTVDVRCRDEDGDDCLVARLAIDHLNLVRAESCGEDVHEICDADSGGWEAAYTALLEAGNDFFELRREYEFDEPVFDVLFLHASIFHPSINDWRMFIVDHAACFFGENSVIAMWNTETGMPESQLARLGFKRIAGHDLLFRPNMVVNDYNREDDARRVLDIEVESSVGSEVENWWNKMGKRA